jgi:hypothetical protein
MCVQARCPSPCPCLSVSNAQAHAHVHVHVHVHEHKHEDEHEHCSGPSCSVHGVSFPLRFFQIIETVILIITLSSFKGTVAEDPFPFLKIIIHTITYVRSPFHC